MFRKLLICCGIVILFDALAALISRSSGINYEFFIIPEATMYLTMGYILFNLIGMNKRSFLILACAAACEATIGWWVSALIGPGKPVAFGVADYVSGALFAVAFGTGLGSIGGWAAKVGAKTVKHK